MSKLNIQKPINKNHLIQYTLKDFNKNFAKLEKKIPSLLTSDDKEYIKNMKKVSKKIASNGLTSLKHNDDAYVVEALILDEPKFISGTTKTSDNKFILPVFNSKIGKLYKDTLHYLLKRLGRVRNKQIEIHANYAVSMPKRIKHCKLLLQNL